MTALEIFALSLGGILLLWAIFAPGGGTIIGRIIAGTVGIVLIAIGVIIGLEERDRHHDWEDRS